MAVHGQARPTLAVAHRRTQRLKLLQTVERADHALSLDEATLETALPRLRVHWWLEAMVRGGLAVVEYDRRGVRCYKKREG